MDPQPAYFDPLSTKDLTTIICGRFEREPLRSLKAELPRFDGSGLYAIYCVGPGSNLYEPLISLTIPIYVGSSHSHSSATGDPASTADPLWRRVRGHRISIAEAGNLEVSQFGVRLLRMPDVHCDLGENGLRVGYRPVWNSILTGFGSNEQGAKTRTSARSRWDTVHPGRKRTFGQEAHDSGKLRARVQERVAEQVNGYHLLPWRSYGV
ncbi:Eco29kI family restriction endonuclease [Micromonospora zingiberis]|uniref:Eco29kI family restriction endonuclease n=1 Tax=Micromonospora zingiberis TaxID=2053011 RepID=A0A4R0GHN4_9ACTN|nr:Eco29kI family restriction endonuclease [Micromonospora zingiberis]TCB96636.1 Eco29kI family restriction endonuclease [Micromonospora zingiberis]